MNRWVLTISIASLCAILIFGCAGGEINNPAIPDSSPEITDNASSDLTPNTPRASESSGDVENYLWGYFDCILDVENGTVEAVPNRNVMFNANVVQFLNENNDFFTFDFINIQSSSKFLDVDMDISITHPFGGLEKFNGYDVRCVFVGYGSGELSNGLKVTDLDLDMHLLDDPAFGDGGGPDGYTRWFNPTEFTTPGLFGYTTGNSSFLTDFTNIATLCPYKYYTDHLDASDDLSYWLDNNPENNGVFTAGYTNTRNFYLRFPNDAGLKWAYAVVASWGGGNPEDHPANTVEAIACDVDDNSVLFYVDETINGGTFDLDVRLYGWGEAVSTIMVESTVLSTPYNATADELIPVDAGTNWTDYHLTFYADNVLSEDDQEMWITAGYDPHTYSNSFGILNDAAGPLTAYFRFPLRIDDEAPECDAPPEISTDTLPEAYVGQEYNLQFEAAGGDGDLTWSLDPSTELPDGLVFSPSGLLSGSPAEGTEGVHSDLVFRVQDTCIGGPQIDSVSLGLIIFNPEVTLSTPNGGEVWGVGTSHEITWTSDDIYTYVDILYSKDNFNMDFQYIAQDEENDGSFQWDYIPADPSDYVRVRVESSTMPWYYDDSDDDFSIAGGWIEVLDPNGGENLATFSNYEILWDSEYVTGNVNIWYSKDDFDEDMHAIALFEPNDGAFLWENIPDDESTTVKIRIESIVNPLLNDESDNYFSISAAPLTVLIPNGGEEYWYGSDEEITWTTGGVTGNVDIRYSTDNFVSDINIIADNTPNDGTHMWTNIPQDFTDSAKVRIRSHDDTGFYDNSDAAFSIVDHGWAVTWGDTTSDTATAVVTDDSGNIYVSGSVENHCMLAKFNKYGVQQWQKEWGNHAADQTIDIGLDSAGKIYLIGVFSDASADFDPGTGSNVLTNNGAQDCFIACYDNSGNHLWAYNWGGADNDFVYGLDVADGGNCYIVGEFIQTVDFDPNGGVIISPNGYGDAYFLRYEPSGSFDWVLTWGTDGPTASESDAAYDVAINSAENKYFVVGTFDDHSTLDLNPHPGEEQFFTSNGGHDMFLSTFDAGPSYDGGYAWGGTTDLDAAYGISLDPNDNIIVCGRVGGADVDMDMTNGADLQSATGDKGNSFVTRLASNEVYQWTNIWGGGPSAFSDDHAYRVAGDSSGAVYVTGSFYDTVDFDPGAGENIHTAPGWPVNAYATKFDSSGNHVWANTIGDTDFEEGLGITVTGTGICYMVGYWGSLSVDFAPNDSSCGIYSDVHVGLGGNDCFLVKYEEDGCW